MKHKLLLSMLATGLIASSVAFAEDHKMGGHEGGHHKGAMMEAVDTDGDGLISKDEFMAKHEEQFKKMDANGDGSLSKDEMKAAWESRKDKMKERRGERAGKKEAPEVDASDDSTAE